jgi:hypothetical protein
VCFIAGGLWTFIAENMKTILKLYLRQSFETIYFFFNLVEGLFFSVLKKLDVNIQVYYNGLFTTSGKHWRSEVSCVFKYSKTLRSV